MVSLGVWRVCCFRNSIFDLGQLLAREPAVAMCVARIDQVLRAEQRAQVISPKRRSVKHGCKRLSGCGPQHGIVWLPGASSIRLRRRTAWKRR